MGMTPISVDDMKPRKERDRMRNPEKATTSSGEHGVEKKYQSMVF
jgi:hypothetical protein